MEAVVQTVEHRVVIPDVAGSIPVSHPTVSLGTPLIWLWENLVIRIVRVDETVRSNRTSQTTQGCIPSPVHANVVLTPPQERP